MRVILLGNRKNKICIQFLEIELVHLALNLFTLSDCCSPTGYANACHSPEVSLRTDAKMNAKVFCMQIRCAAPDLQRFLWVPSYSGKLVCCFTLRENLGTSACLETG